MELSALPCVISALLSAVTSGVGAAAEAVERIIDRRKVSKIMLTTRANCRGARVLILVPLYTW